MEEKMQQQKAQLKSYYEGELNNLREELQKEAERRLNKSKEESENEVN